MGSSIGEFALPDILQPSGAEDLIMEVHELSFSADPLTLYPALATSQSVRCEAINEILFAIVTSVRTDRRNTSYAASDTLSFYAYVNDVTVSSVVYKNGSLVIDNEGAVTNDVIQVLVIGSPISRRS